MPATADSKILATIIKAMEDEENDPLTPLIDRYFIMREKYPDRRIRTYELDLQNRPRPLGRLSPSSLCGCERQAALKFLGVEGKKRLDPDTEAIFDDGHWRHHKWQARFRDMEAVLGRKRFRCYSIEEQIKIPKLYISGHLDALIGMRYQGEMESWVVDIKGINEFGFKAILGSQKPKDEHVLQLLAYMRRKKCRRGILLYENKMTQATMVFVVRFTEERWTEVQQWSRSVLKQLKNRTLPSMHPECDHGSFLYGKCPFRKLCWGNKTGAALERMAFADFPGVEELWRIGLEIEQNV